jgi:hypothetical protein
MRRGIIQDYGARVGRCETDVIRSNRENVYKNKKGQELRFFLSSLSSLSR